MKVSRQNWFNPQQKEGKGKTTGIAKSEVIRVG